MSWRFPPLNAIRTFEAAGRNLSFTLAAKELNVTPGAVSRQIKLLEEHVEIRLFERANREVRLTPAGQDYLDVVTETFAALNQATTRLVQNRASRPLRLVATMTFALRWLVPRLISFYSSHANRDIQLTTSLKPLDFRTDDVDLAVRLGRGDWPNLVSHFLFSSDLVPVCSPKLVAGHPMRNAEDLRRHTLLHSTARPRNWSTWLKGAGLGGCNDSQGVYFESSSLALEAAVEGMGIAIGQTRLVAEDLAAGRLMTPFDIVVREDDGFYLLHTIDGGHNKTLRQFRDWMLREAGPDATRPGAAARVRAAG